METFTKNPDYIYPDSIAHEHYSDVRSHPDDYNDWYVGWVGFIASYNGRFFDSGYAKTIISKTGVERNYYDEAKRNILSQIPNIANITFGHKYYWETNPHQMVVYCDPPYANTKQYATSKEFDHEQFWNVMREWSKNNIVFISEEHAPDDFEIIWQQEVTRTQDNRKRDMAIEKLFRWKGTISC